MKTVGIFVLYLFCCISIASAQKPQAVEDRLGTLELKVKDLESRIQLLERASVDSQMQAPATIQTAARGGKITITRAQLPIRVVLIQKMFKDADATDEACIEFIFDFISMLTKTASSFSGTIFCLDRATRAELLSFTLSTEKVIEPGGTARWIGRIGVNPAGNPQKRLITASYTDLEILFFPDKVTYTDGTEDSFIVQK